MRFGLSQALSPRGFGRASDVLLTLLLSTMMAAIAPAAFAADGRDDPSAAQQQPSADAPKAEDNQAKPDDKPQASAPAAAPADASAPSAAPDLCGALAT